MNSIKTYLLPLVLLIFLSVPAFTQSSYIIDEDKKEQKFSKADSVLAETYLSEIDYNELHAVSGVCSTGMDRSYYNDEIYNQEPIQKNNSRNKFWDAVAVELVVDVAVNTVFIIAAFCH